MTHMYKRKPVPVDEKITAVRPDVRTMYIIHTFRPGGTGSTGGAGRAGGAGHTGSTGGPILTRILTPPRTILAVLMRTYERYKWYGPAGNIYTSY